MYDHFISPDRYFYAEDTKANYKGIAWEEFEIDIYKSAIGPNYKGYISGSSFAPNKFAMEFNVELGQGAENQLRSSYQSFNTPRADLPWYKRHYGYVIRALVNVIADELSINRATFRDSVKAEFKNITGRNID